MNVNVSEQLKGIDNIFLEKMKDWNLPGMAVAVIKNDELILLNELGLRDVKQNLSVSKNTLFAIGSATKAFTSLAIGILVDEGKLDWDTPIKRYMPNFEMHNKYASEHLTIKDMLCHRSGLPRHDMLWYNTSLSRKDLVDRLKHLEFSKDFRETWQYNNLMYATAGYIIELVTGLPWEEFVKTRILEPLGMNNSNFSVDVMKSNKDYSLPYALKEKKAVQIDFRNIDVAGPAGSINSNLSDMIKWIMLHLNKGKVNGKQIISKQSLEQIHSPQIPCQLVPWKFDEIQFSSYGLGWFIESFRGKRHIHHGGNIDGFSSYISFLPDENIAVIILSNLSTPFLTFSVAYSIYDRLLGYEDANWSERIEDELSKMMKSIESINESAKKSTKENTNPSHLIDEYTGKYENAGYGTLEIKKEGNKLKLLYNNLECMLEHKCYDVFVITVMQFYTITVTFDYDNTGDINRISVPFEQSVKDIVFKKCK